MKIEPIYEIISKSGQPHYPEQLLDQSKARGGATCQGTSPHQGNLVYLFPMHVLMGKNTLKA